VPGHGSPFTDVPGALARARRRLAGFHSDPQRHARFGIKMLIKYHLMEVRRQPMDELLDWAVHTPYLHAIRQQHFEAQGNARAWLSALVDELLGSGALQREGEDVVDAVAR